MALRGWKTAPLAEVTAFIGSGISRPFFQGPNGVPVLRSNNVRDGRVVLEDLKYWHSTDPRGANLDFVRPHPGDLLVNFVNGSSKELGKAGLYEGVPAGCIASTNLFIVRFDNKRIRPEFANIVFASRHYRRWLYSAVGFSGQGSFNLREFSQFRIPEPPIDEQDRIIGIARTWDKAITKNAKLIGTKLRLKNGLMKQLLSGERRLPGCSAPWISTKLGNVGRFSKGAGVSKSDAVPNGYPAVRYGELYTTHHVVIKNFKTRISAESARSSTRIRQGDILFAGSGETSAEIGKSAVFLGKFEAYAGGDILILSPRKADPLFLSHLLNSGIVRGFLCARAQGHSVVHLYRRDLQNLPMRIPEIGEQRRISRILAAADGEIEALVSRAEALKKQKRGLMQKLLTPRSV